MEVLRSFAASAKVPPSPIMPAGCAASGKPLQTARLPNEGFDLIYLDAEKKKYADYVAVILDRRTPLLAPGGALLIDNTLWWRGHGGRRPAWWDGGVPEEDAARARRQARVAEAMGALREALRKDPRISHVSARRAMLFLCIKTSVTGYICLHLRVRVDLNKHIYA